MAGSSGAPGVDYKPLPRYCNYEPNSGIMVEISGFVKENRALITLVASLILSAIVVSSIYYGFGDFHHFATWVKDNPSFFSAILTGIGVIGVGALILIKCISDQPQKEEPSLIIDQTIPPPKNQAKRTNAFSYEDKGYSALDPTNFEN